MAGKRLEILYDGGEVELVAGPGETPQTHTLEAVMGFEVRKSHLDLLALVARLFELGRTREAAGIIANSEELFSPVVPARAFSMVAATAQSRS